MQQPSHAKRQHVAIRGICHVVGTGEAYMYENECVECCVTKVHATHLCSLGQDQGGLEGSISFVISHYEHLCGRQT